MGDVMVGKTYLKKIKISATSIQKSKALGVVDLYKAFQYRLLSYISYPTPREY